jgi:hypothetical protein
MDENVCIGVNDTVSLTSVMATRALVTPVKEVPAPPSTATPSPFNALQRFSYLRFASGSSAVTDAGGAGSGIV